VAVVTIGGGSRANCIAEIMGLQIFANRLFGSVREVAKLRESPPMRPPDARYVATVPWRCQRQELALDEMK
jgi:hypothetical protein